MKASGKTAHDKVFFILGQKGHFPPQNGSTIKNIGQWPESSAVFFIMFL